MTHYDFTSHEPPPLAGPGPYRTDQPPPEVRNVLLWRQARHNQQTHDCHPHQDSAPTCRFCGTEWPCDPRLNADEALAASFSMTTTDSGHPVEPVGRALPDVSSYSAVGVATVHPDWAGAPHRSSP